MDQVRDKNTPVISINEAIKTSFNYNLKTNSASGIMKTIQGLKVSEQPKTDCKVTFSQYHPATNTLSICLKPHFLIINQTDIPIITKVANGSTWLIESESVFHPPSLNNQKFFFGLFDETIEKETWGTALELSDHDWTYLSIRPSIQGILYLHGTISYKLLNSQSTISCFVTLVSDVCDGIRVITIKPSFIVNNQTNTKLFIKSCLVPEKDKTIDEVKTYQAVEDKIVPISFLL